MPLSISTLLITSFTHLVLFCILSNLPICKRTMDNDLELLVTEEYEQSEEMGQDHSHSPKGFSYAPHESDKKRSRRAMVQDDSGLDDILNSITSKLDSLSTNPDERKEKSIKAFIEVLGCSDNDASFYLESSAWDIETALSLWFENNPGIQSQSTYASYTLSSSGNAYNPVSVLPMIRPEGGWMKRDVVIEGLDPEWKATVSRTTGQIYFTHIATGVSQQCVPPGFADSRNRDIAAASNSSLVTDTDTGNGTTDDAIKLTSTNTFSVFDIGSSNPFSSGSHNPIASVSRTAKRGSRGPSHEPLFSVFDPYYMIPGPYSVSGSGGDPVSSRAAGTDCIPIDNAAQFEFPPETEITAPEMDTTENLR